jgi:hypothetical protein
VSTRKYSEFPSTLFHRLAYIYTHIYIYIYIYIYILLYATRASVSISRGGGGGGGGGWRVRRRLEGKLERKRKKKRKKREEIAAWRDAESLGRHRSKRTHRSFDDEAAKMLKVGGTGWKNKCPIRVRGAENVQFIYNVA